MSFDVTFKIGDLPHKEKHMSTLDLMPIDWHDKPIIGKNTLSTIGVMTLPDSAKPFIIDAVKPLDALIYDYNWKKPLTYRKKRKVINWEYLKNKVPGSSDLYNNLSATGVKVPRIDLRHVTDMDKLFKHSSLIDMNENKIDRNFISGGDITIGSGGGDTYATYAILDADLVNTTTPLNSEMTTDVTETAPAIFTQILTHKWTNWSNTFGDPTVGKTLSIGHASTGIRIQSGGANFEFRNINFKRTVGSSNNIGIFEYTSASPISASLHDCFFKGTGSGRNIILSTDEIDIYNCIGRDHISFIHMVGGGGLDVRIKNCGSENMLHGLNLGNFAATVENVWSFNSGINFIQIAGATGRNNADSDGTGANGNWNIGTNNQPNLTPANEVELNDTIASYGLPIAGQTLDTGGIDPVIFAFYMNLVAVASPFPIGPKKIPTLGSPWYAYLQQQLQH